MAANFPMFGWRIQDFMNPNDVANRIAEGMNPQFIINAFNQRGAVMPPGVAQVLGYAQAPLPPGGVGLLPLAAPVLPGPGAPFPMIPPGGLPAAAGPAMAGFGNPALALGAVAGLGALGYMANEYRKSKNQKAIGSTPVINPNAIAMYGPSGRPTLGVPSGTPTMDLRPTVEPTQNPLYQQIFDPSKPPLFRQIFGDGEEEIERNRELPSTPSLRPTPAPTQPPLLDSLFGNTEEKPQKELPRSFVDESPEVPEENVFREFYNRYFGGVNPRNN